MCAFIPAAAPRAAQAGGWQSGSQYDWARETVLFSVSFSSLLFSIYLPPLISCACCSVTRCSRPGSLRAALPEQSHLKSPLSLFSAVSEPIAEGGLANWTWRNWGATLSGYTSKRSASRSPRIPRWMVIYSKRSGSSWRQHRAHQRRWRRISRDTSVWRERWWRNAFEMWCISQWKCTKCWHPTMVNTEMILTLYSFVYLQQENGGFPQWFWPENGWYARRCLLVRQVEQLNAWWYFLEEDAAL